MFALPAFEKNGPPLPHCMANPKFVEDIGIVDGDVAHYEIGLDYQAEHVFPGYCLRP